MPLDKENSRHEAHLYRLLSEILDDKYLSSNAFFKGGTAAYMLGYLDRFSVDLDFDLKESADKEKARKKLYKIFDKLDLKIDDQSQKALQFFLKYSSPPNQRNTIKLEILDKVFKNNDYQPKHLPQIDRTAVCQTIETMFAHKLIAPTDRYEKRKSIAGRDIYDIHHFFLNGYDYKKEIIKERTNKSPLSYLQQLKTFIAENVTRKTLEEDLNVLLEDDKFQSIRKHLKQETINLLNKEISESAQ